MFKSKQINKESSAIFLFIKQDNNMNNNCSLLNNKKFYDLVYFLHQEPTNIFDSLTLTRFSRNSQDSFPNLNHKRPNSFPDHSPKPSQF